MTLEAVLRGATYCIMIRVSEKRYEGEVKRTGRVEDVDGGGLQCMQEAMRCGTMSVVEEWLSRM